MVGENDGRDGVVWRELELGKGEGNEKSKSNSKDKDKARAVRKRNTFPPIAMNGAPDLLWLGEEEEKGKRRNTGISLLLGLCRLRSRCLWLGWIKRSRISLRDAQTRETKARAKAGDGWGSFTFPLIRDETAMNGAPDLLWLVEEDYGNSNGQSKGKGEYRDSLCCGALPPSVEMILAGQKTGGTGK